MSRIPGARDDQSHYGHIDPTAHSPLTQRPDGVISASYTLLPLDKCPAELEPSLSTDCIIVVIDACQYDWLIHEDVPDENRRSGGQVDDKLVMETFEAVEAVGYKVLTWRPYITDKASPLMDRQGNILPILGHPSHGSMQEPVDPFEHLSARLDKPNIKNNTSELWKQNLRLKGKLKEEEIDKLSLRMQHNAKFEQYRQTVLDHERRISTLRRGIMEWKDDFIPYFMKRSKCQMEESTEQDIQRRIDQ
ncbi:hypothetical protein FBEOM_3198 [Fusarium beomiforme]|uniref:Uncharacterized protein n=1 Tax=Fusarium beomiforme TaxID=44412 RepID=A0A9P5E270_9HYPO|nr:hypothetical protein FBEOM_3198 [Fusarium beomiforme]